MLINLVLTGLNAFNFEMEPDNENWFMAILFVNNSKVDPISWTGLARN